jgi:hypothetical protein
MSNKKTLKMTKRNSKRGKSRKGGFFGFFKDKHNEQNPQCNPNNLVKLTSTIDIKNKIDTCCPKSWYGRKNNSPYCKELDQKYDAATTTLFNKMNESNANGVISDDNGLRPSEIAHLEGALQQNNTIGPSQINCKDYNLANTLTNKQKMEEYIKTCDCSKSRWNPFSKKRKNCGIVNKKLKELQEPENFDNRPTEVFNKKPLNQGYIETDSESDYGKTDSETDSDSDIDSNRNSNSDKFLPSQNIDPTKYNDAEYDVGDEELKSDLVDDQNYKYNYYDTLRPGRYNTDTVIGGKRRRTKKHFIKRSIGKRSIKKGRKTRKY